MEVLAVIKHFLESSEQQVKFHRHMLRIDNLDKAQGTVLENINELYELFPDKTSITPAELKAYIKKKNPSRDTSYYNDLIDSAVNQQIGPEITKTLMEAVIERHMAAKIMALASPIVSNQKTGLLAEVDTVMQEYRDLCSLADKRDQLMDCDITFQQAIEFRSNDSGIKWPLAGLTKAMGGVVPSLGLVIARPDTGKTSFMLNCLAYFAVQLRGTDRQLLYVGNEEGIIGLKARFGVSLLGVTTEWAESHPRQFGEQISQRNGDCVRFHGGVRSTRDVETLIKRYQPVVTVADQVAKFKIPGNTEEGPKALASVYGWFRNISQEEQTMIMGVGQAGASAKQWVTMDDINGSKTDVPGELDWGLGIGILEEQGMERVRFFNIFKNKLKYGRKGRAQVTFDPDTCRYSD